MYKERISVNCSYHSKTATLHVILQESNWTDSGSERREERTFGSPGRFCDRSGATTLGYMAQGFEESGPDNASAGEHGQSGVCSNFLNSSTTSTSSSNPNPQLSTFNREHLS